MHTFLMNKKRSKAIQSNNRIKITLDRLQLKVLLECYEAIAEKAPIEDYEVESCLMLETYKRLFSKLYISQPGVKFTVLSLSYAEAYALHFFASDQIPKYNVFLRQLIEPVLPLPKKNN